MFIDVSLSIVSYALYLFLALCMFLFRYLPALASRMVFWPSPFPFVFYFSLLLLRGIQRLFLIQGPTHAFLLDLNVFHIGFWVLVLLKASTFFLPFPSVAFFTFFSVTILQNASILDFSVFSIVQVSVPYRATLRRKLFISDFPVFRLTVFEVNRFLFFYSRPVWPVLSYILYLYGFLRCLWLYYPGIWSLELSPAMFHLKLCFRKSAACYI